MLEKYNYHIQDHDSVLLLAAKYFSHLIGFSSFDEFLKQTHYYKINISTNKVVENHNASRTINMANPGDDYDKVLMEIAKNYVYEEDRGSYVAKFDAKKMENDWKDGKDFLEDEIRLVYEGRQVWVHIIYEVYKIQDCDDVFADICVFNIDEFKRKNEKVMDSSKDVLTGLYNRTAIEVIDERLKSKFLKSAVLLTFDIDNFKQINDRYGHSFGDKIIKKCAGKIDEYFNENGIVCRIGGDEFVALSENKNASEIETKLKKFVKEPVCFKKDGKDVFVTISVGFSVYPKNGDDYKKLYKKADMAMYSVKMDVKGTFRMFNENLLKQKRDSLGFNVSEISKSMPGGFMIYKADETCEIVFANDELIKMMGCTDFDDFIELTGGSFLGFVHPEDVRWVSKSINHQLEKADKNRDYVRYRVITKSGEEKMVDDYGHVVDSKNNGRLFFVFILDLDYRNELRALIKKK